jgi:hypothetical protein
VLDPATGHLGINATANPDFWIQTYGNIASGLLYDPTLGAGTHHDVANGGGSGLQFSAGGTSIITGIVNPFVTTAGTTFFILFNASASEKVILKHQDAGSATANQFTTPDEVDYVLKPRQLVLLYGRDQTGWFIIDPSAEKTPLAVTASATLDLQINDKFNVTVNAAPITLTLSNPIAGKTYVFSMIQGATPDTITFAGTTIKWRENTPYVANAVANTVDSVTLYYDGTNLIGNFGVDYA